MLTENLCSQVLYSSFTSIIKSLDGSVIDLEISVKVVTEYRVKWSCDFLVLIITAEDKGLIYFFRK